jgi:predicted SAM-dependent methyltransferase
MKKMFNRLNMGCGFKKLKGYWNVDVSEKCNPDEIFDFDNVKWPWKTDFFERIHANNCLEHLGQTPKAFLNVIKEMYRISKDGCEWDINVPHHRCDNYWNDFTHVRVITPTTFMLFDQQKNVNSLKNNLSDSVFGLMNDIDLEVINVQHHLTHLFSNVKDEKHPSGYLQLDVDLNTLSNVAESVTITVRVHKPCRFANYLTNK